MGTTRAERVVHAVIQSTLQALAESGYSALTIEDVAERAGVNKTTIYRRWPTKSALVRDALLFVRGEHAHDPDTGNVREDLIAWLQKHLTFVTSPLGQSIVRTVMVEGFDSEIAMISRSLRQEHEQVPMRILERGVRRGELSKRVPKRLILSVLLGATMHRLFVAPDGTDDLGLEALVDLLLSGAKHWAKKSRLRAEPARRKKTAHRPHRNK